MQRRLCEMSEAKWSITEAKCLQISHNKYASQRDAISPLMGNLMLSHSAGMHHPGISSAGICPNKFERAKGSKRFHFASLISHNLRCIPAYTHLIPTGFFQSSLNDYRDNLYIISKLKMGVSRFFQSPQHTLIFVSILVSTDFNQPLRLRFLGR